MRLAKRRFTCASISSSSTSASSFILIHPTVWPQYTDVTERTGQTGRWSDSIGQTVLQMVAQKLKPGLVDSYDIQPGNREGLFWFWRFINLSLTYLLTLFVLKGTLNSNSLTYLDTCPLTYSSGATQGPPVGDTLQ